jgi:diacylglycerol kinase family enzyme
VSDPGTGRKETPLVLPSHALRLLLIVNSFASSVTARNTVLVQQTLGAVADVSTVETNRRGHATRFAQDAASRGVEVVAVFGGDGTLNEAVNGIAGTDTALAVLPGGSTNVFARILGIPNDPVPAANAMADAIKREGVRAIGLGSVNRRYFCFHTGVGFDAAVVGRVERSGSLKRWAGHPLFVWAGLRTWMSGYDRHHPHFGLSFPLDETVPDGYLTIVLNSDPYTYLGNRPLSLAPAADLDRGLVALTFRSLSAGTMLSAIGRALRGRALRASAHLDVRTDLAGLNVSSATPFPYQVDGDYLGDTRRLSFRHEPDALRVLVP